MASSELKTKKTRRSVEKFLAQIADDQQRADCRRIAQVMQQVTGEEPAMWGSGMVGFGTYHYKYPTGREGDWFVTGFSPRARDLTVYLTYGFADDGELLARLGKHSTGKACLYIKSLDAVNVGVLTQLVQRSVRQIRKQYPA